jgi:glutamate-1-semialdehyde 2,1-aminomutase
VEAIRAQAGRGTSFGAPTRLEVEMAETLRRLVPSLEMVRMVNSGTEATLSALRLARGATGRPKLVKFEGCYHGHGDSFLIKAGSGAATFGSPDSPGVTEATARDTVTAVFNDLESVARRFRAHPGAVAAVIVEPVVGNMGVVAPRRGFLEGLRELCTAQGSILIFDEVMTGFRVAYGGAQELFGIVPDLTCLGKVIGGGLPVGAYGGPAELMSRMAPAGPVYQAGTLSGNPLTMAAGCATLDALRDGAAYDRLEALGARLAAGLAAGAEESGTACAVNRVGSMLTPFLGVDVVTDYAAARGADAAAFRRLHAAWLEGGVFWPPSQYEAGFLSTAHGEAEVDRAAEIFAAALAAGSSGGG